MIIDEIFEEIRRGAVQVANLLQKREVEYTQNSNSSGDNQLKVDILADRLFAGILSELRIKGYASEEQDGITFLAGANLESQNLKSQDSKSHNPSHNPESQNFAQTELEDSRDSKNRSGLEYDFSNKTQDVLDSNNSYNLSDLLIAYDPLDGSSLIDSNLSIGSIFGVYNREFSGENLIAAMYILYGPRLEICVASNNKSSHYIYNYATHKWNFVQDFRLKDSGKINAPGGTQKFWSERHKALVQSFFNDGYRLRYSGAMVADLHQILCKGGGIFSYPATSENPKGKLRGLFEALPFALIFEFAGGGAVSGASKDSNNNSKNAKDCRSFKEIVETTRLLNIKTESIHDTTPCFFGSKSEIERVVSQRF